MSIISQRPAVGGINLFQQAFSGNPANTPQPTTGTGSFDPNAVSYVGQKFETSDGRELTIILNGAVALTTGKLVQSAAQVTAFQGLAMTVPAATPATAGTFQVLVTNGATVLNVNQYQGGFLVTASGTGLGQTLRIASHAPAAANATFLVTLEDAILTTLDATTTVHLIYSPYANVIINPTTGTAAPVGATLYPIAASTAATYSGTTGALTANGVSQYGLIVNHGPTAILQDSDGATVGYPIGASDLTAGAVGIATLTTQPQIGIAMQTTTSAQYSMVFLQL